MKNILLVFVLGLFAVGCNDYVNPMYADMEEGYMCECHWTWEQDPQCTEIKEIIFETQQDCWNECNIGECVQVLY